MEARPTHQIAAEDLDRILDVQYKKIIKFDISGEKYECTEEILLPVKDSLLGRALYEDPVLTKDAKGYFFFDRNGKCFSYILDYLRTKQQSWPKDDQIEKKMRKEFEFFGIHYPLFEKEKAKL